MANGVQRRRKPAQNGVQAIFTQDADQKGKALGILGMIAMGAGAALWLWTVFALRGFTGQVVLMDTVSSSLTFVSLAVLLIVGGVGLSTYRLAVQRTKRENYKIASAIFKLDEPAGPKEAAPNTSLPSDQDPASFDTQVSRPGFPKALALAAIEGLVLILLYTGLLAEYRSNIHMQEWVRANVAVFGIGFGEYLLNDIALMLVTATLSAALVFQWRLKKNGKESLQN